MNTALIKNNFHKLIDKIENENLLEQFYKALFYSAKKESTLWNSLSKKEKKELLLSYEESLDEKNLIPLEQVKAKHSKWLSK